MLMGQAFSSLVQLMALQPARAPSAGRGVEWPPPAAGASEDVKLRQHLEALRGRKVSATSWLADPSEAGEGTAKGLPSTAITTGEEDEGQVDACSVFVEEDEEAPESSGALCRLVFGEDAAAENSEGQQQCQRRLGSLHPPASVFTSRLRPYQAQGLWWMLHCESETSVFQKGDHEVLDPLWTMYRLPPRRTGTRGGGCASGAHPSEMQSQAGAPGFVPSFFYVNVSAGLVSISKPRQTGRIKGGILADCMGLGKTVQVLALIAISALQERDPTSAASWLAAAAGGRTADERMTSRAARGARSLKSPSRPSAPAEPEVDVCLISPSSSQDSLVHSSPLPSSPLSVSSDGEPASSLPALDQSSRLSTADSSTARTERRPLLAPDPRMLQRSLQRDQDNLLQGGTLVVVPLSLIGQWQSEVERHLVRGVATVIQYHGPARPRDPKLLAAHTIVLTTYQTLASDFRYLSKMTGRGEDSGALPQSALTVISAGLPSSPLANIRFRRLILDEGHIIKNTSSLVNRACNALKADAR